MSTPADALPLLLDPDYRSLKQYLIESTGLSYYADKDGDLAARISARLSHLVMNGCGDYLDLLKDQRAGESERHLLIGQLTIGETYFFRHTEQFEALRDLALPELIERNRDRRSLRIWSAGCAIGAEPYTLAILLKQHFADRLAGWDVQIIGSDINPAFLARAGRGEFDERALRSTADDFKHAWFTRTGTSWTINSDVRQWVSFQYHNLVEHPYPSIVHGIVAVDLILCRNVMIYFNWEVIARIIARFRECLVDGGWLAVGHAESNPEIFRAYRTVNAPGATLYQKTGEPAAAGFPLAMPEASASWQPAPYAPQQAWSAPVLPAIPAAPRSLVEPPHAAPVISELTQVRQLADEGKWAAAARGCDGLLERDQLNPAVHFYRALVVENLGDLPGAEGSFRRAIYLDRAFVLAHYHLALLLAKTGRRDAAIQSIRNVERLLARMDKRQEIADADGLTVDDLGRLTAMHLDLWKK